MPQLYQYPIPRNEGVSMSEWTSEEGGCGIGSHGGDLSHTDNGYPCVGIWVDNGGCGTYWRSSVFKLDALRFPRGGFITNIQFGGRRWWDPFASASTWTNFILYKMVGTTISEQLKVTFDLGGSSGQFTKFTYDLLAPYDISDWTDGFKLCIYTGANSQLPMRMVETHHINVKIYAVPKYRLIVNVKTPTNTSASGALMNVLWADTGEYVTTASADSAGQVTVDLLAGRYQLAITHSTGGKSGISVDLNTDSIIIPVTLISGSSYFVTVKAITPDGTPVYGKTITLDTASAKTEANFAASGGIHTLTAELNGFLEWFDGVQSNSRSIGVTGTITYTAIYESAGDGGIIDWVPIVVGISLLGVGGVALVYFLRRKRRNK